MSRREIRENIFKLLFMSNFNQGEEMDAQLKLYMENIENTREEDRTYIREKYGKVREKLEEIDQMLNETAKGWKTSRMSKVDLNVLRLAVYELKYDEDVPTGVAINEAVELAKKFGGEESPAFVNGILAKIA
ncbi:MAG TPA: transcription antitermination factor NusB [Candidatus Egerieimonas intestinavium]|uniref:Transcription antitermination protein NusB n=1 Tax=Candidatus Egerieimonas intestinavium TaxID=2840777 RepID=A0A9D1EK27_9FIRM|nr:transcription antitermination factor NusB [Candidatus Egerieimonas intestinavium]